MNWKLSLKMQAEKLFVLKDANLKLDANNAFRPQLSHCLERSDAEVP